MKKAFTLVEMLVSVILLSLLIAVALFSLRLQLLEIRKLHISGIEKVLRYNQLRASIESIKYYVVQDYDILNLPIKYKWHYFFLGNKKIVNFITYNPIFSKEEALVELSCQDDKLIYREEPLYKRINFLRPKLLKDSKKYELFENLDNCQLSYQMFGGSKRESIKGEIPEYIIIKTNETYFIKLQNDYNLTKINILNGLYNE